MPKPLILCGIELKTPPLSEDDRRLMGYLLRQIQAGAMPTANHHFKPFTTIGPQCFELRVNQWRLFFHIASDHIVVLELHAKKTRATPTTVIDRCKKRLKNYQDL